MGEAAGHRFGQIIGEEIFEKGGPHDLDHRTAHDHIRCNMTKDEELERLYKAYDEQHEMFKQLYYKQAEAHRYQLDVIWSVLNFHWQVIKVRLK